MSHRENCPSRYQVEVDADIDFQYYGAGYRRYYDGCYEAERHHKEEMRRLEEQAAAERRAQERREEERRMEEYYAEQSRQAEEEEYWRQQEEQMRQLEAEDAEVQSGGPGHDVR